MASKAAEEKAKLWVSRYMGKISYYVDESKMKNDIIPGHIANALDAYDLTDAPNALGEVILGRARAGYHIEYMVNKETTVKKFTSFLIRSIYDALRIYKDTGSLWYAEFVGNSVSAGANKWKQYASLIAPVISNDALTGKMLPDESDIVKNTKGERGKKYTRFSITLEQPCLDKVWDIRAFYANMMKFTTDVIPYFEEFGFRRLASIVNIIAIFPLRRYGITRSRLMDLIIEAYHDDDKDTFPWLLNFLIDIIRKPMNMAADVKIDLDWVHAHQQYSTDFLRETLPITDNAIADADYDARGHELLDIIRKTIKAPDTTNLVVGSISDMFDIDRERTMSGKQMAMYYDVMKSMEAIPATIWNCIAFYGADTPGTYHPMKDPYHLFVPIDLFSYGAEYHTKITKTGQYLHSLMKKHDIDVLYRQAMLSNIQNSFKSCNVFQYQCSRSMMGIPREITQYVNHGIIPNTITYTYADRKVIVKELDIWVERKDNGSSIEDNMFHIIGMMKHLPTTYQEFMDIVAENNDDEYSCEGRDIYLSESARYAE